MAKKKAKLLLVDGTLFCFRAYYAIRHLSNSKGEATNAIYGFLSAMKKLIQVEQPDYFAICFDREEPTFRHEKFESYKAHRKPAPDDLLSQFEPIREFCKAYNYAVFEKAGFEADDLVGTLAKRGEAEGFDVFIATGDKDALQLVGGKVKVLNPNKEGVVFDIEQVKKRFDGLGPEKILDIMALTGDVSDNIPGVRGIGEKTAVKLIKQFGSVEKLYGSLDKIKSKRQQEMLKDGAQDAVLSKDLVAIDTDVAIKFKWEDLELHEPNEKKLIELLKHYEFQNLLDQVYSGESKPQEKSEKRNYHLISEEKDFDAFLKSIRDQKEFSFDTETTSSDAMRAKLVGMSFCWKAKEAYYVPVASKEHQGSGLALDDVIKKITPILEDPKKKKFGQNLKYDFTVMRRYGVHLQGIDFDTMVASYLINPSKPNHNLDDISLSYLGIRKIPTDDLLGKGKSQITMDQVPLEALAEYACEDADCVFRLVPLLKKRLKEDGLIELFEKLEMPLVEVLAKMEMNGVNLDEKLLGELSVKTQKDLERLTQDIYKEAGEEFNINSTKQLGVILFEKLSLPVVKKTKTGFSTDVSVLEKLSDNYELPRKILEYRERAKLKSTYLDALPEIVNPETGLVHTSYHQATTATGRLSSSEPNLQNIPIRTEAGRLVRKAFVPRELKKGKGVILSADYSQIELRILALVSKDKNLVKAFKNDWDIHRFTATSLYGVKDDDVTREMRNVAKVINFSIIYGKTAYGLSKDLNLSVQEADEFIKEYFKRYSGVRDYMESQKEKAREQGYLTTLLGRRAYFPEINSQNGMRRQFAERAAINAPIQGSAADLIKLAMIALQKRLEKEAPESFMIMQVHDELVFDTPKSSIDKVSAIVREEMEGAYPKSEISFKVDLHVGESWYKD